MSIKMTPTLLLFIAVNLINLESCRSRPKSASIESQSAQLKVTLLDIRDGDQNQTNFRYILKDCGSGTASPGVIDKEASTENPVVKFNVEGITAGDVCGLDVKIDSLDAYPAAVRFTDENLLMYSGNNGTVTLGLKGEFVAKINLKPNYYHEVTPEQQDEQYSIEMTMSFPEAVTNPDKIAAFLYCTPEVKHLPSAFVAKGATKGVFQFRAIHSGNAADQHQCSKITIFTGDNHTYYANLSIQIFKFAATPGQMVNFANTEITLQKVQPPPSKIILETIEGKQCDPDKEVFDINKKICVPKPPQN